MNVAGACRAAVIDEIELAQQIGGRGQATGAHAGTKYLPPHLHTLAAAETSQLQRKQWVGKLQETKDALAKLQGSVLSRMDRLEQVRKSHDCLHWATQLGCSTAAPAAWWYQRVLTHVLQLKLQVGNNR